MNTPSPAVTLAREVYVTQGWPGGFCPIHVLEKDARCHWACMDARVELARIARDLANEWSLWERRQRLKHHVEASTPRAIQLDPTWLSQAAMIASRYSA